MANKRLEKATKKTLLVGTYGLASSIIMWQKECNNAMEELEKADGKKRLRVKIDTPDEIINSHLFYDE